jgi:glycogen debranching enzyme
MSKLNFNTFSEKSSLSKYIYSILIPHMKYIKEDKWKGLPELMNKDNTECPGSCNTQAWSIAGILEALYEMNKKA